MILKSEKKKCFNKTIHGNGESFQMHIQIYVHCVDVRAHSNSSLLVFVVFIMNAILSVYSMEKKNGKNL